MALGFASRSPELFTSSFLNSIVAAVGVALPVGGRLGGNRTLVASVIGGIVALVLMAGFFVYQKWRYDTTTAGLPKRD